MFDFYYQVGNARRKSFHVKGDVCNIGSARNNDLVINARTIGKRHAELRLKTDGIHISDLGSLDGCWVNNERVMSHGPVAADSDVYDRQKTKAKKGLFSKFGFGSSKDELEQPLSAPDNGLGEQSTEYEVAVEPEKSAGVASSVSVAAVNEEQTQATFTNDAVQASNNEPDSDDQIENSEKQKLDDQYAYWASIIHEQLLYQMDLRRKDVNRMTDEELREESTTIVDSIIEQLSTQLPDNIDIEILQENVLNEAVGLGPLQQFLDDEDVTEIMVNNYKEIFVERAGKLERSRYRFSSDRTVSAVIERIITPIGRRIDESSPIVDARLKDGSRVNAVIPPLALKGPSMTIRKFPKHRLAFTDLIKYGSINDSMVEFLRVCVEMRKNIIVAGGTGSGKTTLLNVLSNFIPASDRVVTIEDAAELKLVQPNLVSLEARPPNLEGKGAIPIRDLVKNSLRMRPDRIVVGECRGGEALDMLQAMNTGHDGSLTTIHANSPRDVISRLEVLVLMAGMELPVSAIREQVASAVDVIIQQTRFHCGSRKISRITEVVGVESGTVQLQDVFIFDQSGVNEEGRVQGNFKATGSIPTFYEELRNIGIEVDLSAFAEEVKF